MLDEDAHFLTDGLLVGCCVVAEAAQQSTWEGREACSRLTVSRMGGGGAAAVVAAGIVPHQSHQAGVAGAAGVASAAVGEFADAADFVPHQLSGKQRFRGVVPSPGQQHTPELVWFSKNATSCLMTDLRNAMRMLAACLLPVRIQHAACR